MGRKDHLAALADETLEEYTQWLRRSITCAYVDFPQWILSNIRSELAGCLAEKGMREAEPQER